MSSLSVLPDFPIYAIIDTETTGLDATRDTVVEIGAALYQGGRKIDEFQTFVDPQRPIPAEVSAVHHIIDADVAFKPVRTEAIESLRAFLSRATVYVAHNVGFDASFLPEINDRRWLCTMRLAKHLWPDAPNFKNQTLRYHLNLAVNTPNVHRALDDIEVTAAVLFRGLSLARERYGTRSVTWLCDFVDHPCELLVMPRGDKRSKGKRFSDFSDDDLRFWLDCKDCDRDLRFTIEQEAYIREALARVDLAS